MSITWVKNKYTGNDEAFLGEIRIGGIIWEHSHSSWVCHANCLLPDIHMSIRAFADFAEAKEDYEFAVDSWLKKAGIA